MYLSELQNKDIISVKTGINLGRIIDAEVDMNGHIVNIVAENKKYLEKYGKIVKLLLHLMIFLK